MSLILASTSAIRRSMLDSAGVAATVESPGVDEAALKADFDDPEVIARRLAKAKALAVSAAHPADWVIGSDSVVSVGDRLFDKPRDRGEAADHLRAFSGTVIRLTSAVALAIGGAVDWCHADTAALHVRRLSDRFIADYLDSEWPDVAYCAGVFRMEGRGVQLFDTIAGDHFTILGMPLLPLLGALRQRKIIAS